MRVHSLDIYGYNDDFALSMINEVVSENLCEVTKDTGGVRVLMRSTIMLMAKFKQARKMSVAIKPIRGCRKLVAKFQYSNKAIVI